MYRIRPSNSNSPPCFAKCATSTHWRRNATTAAFWSTLLFVGPLLVFWLGVLASPELVYTVLSPGNAANMESMYNPENRVLGAARDADTNWGMFGFYIYNNISVAFRTFASGLLL